MPKTKRRRTRRSCKSLRNLNKMHSLQIPLRLPRLTRSRRRRITKRRPKLKVLKLHPIRNNPIVRRRKKKEPHLMKISAPISSSFKWLLKILCPSNRETKGLLMKFSLSSWYSLMNQWWKSAFLHYKKRKSLFLIPKLKTWLINLKNKARQSNWITMIRY